MHVAASPEATCAGLQLSEEIVSGASTVSDAVFEDPFSVAVTATALSLDTAPAVAANVTVLAPAANVIAAGTVTAAWLLASPMVTPLAGAAPLTVTVHAAASPEATVAGLQLSEEIVSGASTVSDVVFEDPFNVAVTTAPVSVETEPAKAENVAALAPAATVIAAGTVTAAWLLASPMVTPLAGAAPLTVTVHAAASPEATVAGLQLSEEIVSGASTVSDAVLEEPFNVAVTIAPVSAETEPDMAANVAVLAPAATVTAAGTVTAAWLLPSATVTPLAGAGLVIPTVHEDVPGLAIIEGEQDIELTAAGSVAVTLPPAANTGMESPAPEAPIAPTTPIDVEPANGGRVTATTAMTPSGIGALFIPAARQVTKPVR